MYLRVISLPCKSEDQLSHVGGGFHFVLSKPKMYSHNQQTQCPQYCRCTFKFRKGVQGGLYWWKDESHKSLTICCIVEEEKVSKCIERMESV